MKESACRVRAVTSSEKLAGNVYLTLITGSGGSFLIFLLFMFFFITTFQLLFALFGLLFGLPSHIAAADEETDEDEDTSGHGKQNDGPLREEGFVAIGELY